MGSGGWAVPSIVEENVIRFRKHEAKYVLLIEKDAVWTRFNEDKFWKRNNCIIVHGGGQPPRGVRRLVQRLHSELKLPVYVLVDNDPWGFYIYSVMKQGSINLAYESMRMAVPDARFVGLSSFDKEKYALPTNVAIKMDDGDNSRAKQMLAYPWFKHAALAAGDPGDGAGAASSSSSRRSPGAASASSPRSTCRRSCGTGTGWSSECGRRVAARSPSRCPGASPCSRRRPAGRPGGHEPPAPPQPPRRSATRRRGRWRAPTAAGRSCRGRSRTRDRRGDVAAGHPGPLGGDRGRGRAALRGRLRPRGRRERGRRGARKPSTGSPPSPSR